MNKHLTAVAFLLSFLSTSASFSQSTQLLHLSDTVPRLELRYLHTFFNDGQQDYAISTMHKNPFYSATYEVAFSYPLNKALFLSASLPFSYTEYEMSIIDLGYGGYGYSDGDVGRGGYGGYVGDPLFLNETSYDHSEQAWGNIMLGLTYNKTYAKARKLQVQGQLFIPTASRGKSNSVWNMAARNMTEFFRYANNTTTVLTKVLYGTQQAQGWNYAISGGFYYTLTGTQAPVGDDLFMNYSLGGSYHFKNLAASCEFIGAAIVTEDSDNYDDFFDRTLNSANLGLHYTKGAFIPCIFYSTYLRANIREELPGILGVKLSYRFGK